MSLNPLVKHGGVDDFFQLLPPSAFMGGVDFRGCFVHWLVAPPRRRLLGARRPVSGRLGVYPSLPFGLGPSPDRTDCCDKEFLRAARVEAPSLRIIDFADDLRRLDASGAHAELFFGMSKFKKLLGRSGVPYHKREGKHRWPTRSILWLDFTVEAGGNVVRIEEKGVTKGMSLRHGTSGLRPGSTTSARAYLPSVTFLNFAQRVVPGGFFHLRDGSNVVNEPGFME